VYFLDGNPIELSPLDLLRIIGIHLLDLSSAESISLPKNDLKRVEVRKIAVEKSQLHHKKRKLKIIIPLCDVSCVGQTLDENSSSGIALAKHA
jgi:hypothetical protein